MTRKTAEIPGTKEPRRSRWPVVCGALVLLWCAWGYCRGEDIGLFLVTAGVAAAAAALPRALPGNTRWVVWTWVAMTVVCLTANVARIVPPENALTESRALDRIITAAYAVGLTALVFRPCVTGVTVIALGAFPMLMLTLGRSHAAGLAAEGLAPWLAVWGFVALVMLHDQAQRLTQARGPSAVAAGRREGLLRFVALAAVLAAAAGLRSPIEQGAGYVQKRLLGLVMETPGSRSARSRDLQLAQAVSKDFGKRVRVVLLVRAEGQRLPGYLRESVFTAYRSGRWLAANEGVALRALDGTASGDGAAVYPLVPSAHEGAGAAWRVEVLAPRLLTGICLPGNASALMCAGPAPLAETNGAVTAKELFPERYELSVVPRPLTESAFPLPDAAGDPAYLAVPPALAGAVSNWVADCAGLAESRPARASVARIEAYFATNFVYRLGLWMNPTPDPLVDFMKRRAGSCTHFASAAALMFRQCGLPSRVVGGYVCCEWSPWLGRWVVRERDGHAWVEVWDAGQRQWLLADPTPPAGHPSARSRPGKARLALDLVLATWNRFLFTLKNANLLALLADAGGLFFLFVWHAVWSPGGAVVLAGFALLVWVRRQMVRRRLAPEGRLRAELAETMRQLARRAVPERLVRRPYESWGAWLKRVEPELPAEAGATLRALAERYQVLRYRPHLNEAAARAWLVEARRSLR